MIFIAVALLSGCIQPAGDGGNGMATEKVEAGDHIAVEYRGTLDDGSEFDSSEGRAPLEFTAGAGQMIQGFDNAVIGMSLNEEKTVRLEPSEAYGETDPARVIEISREQIGDADSLKPGMAVTASNGASGVVKEVRAGVVVIDFNHPLAGKTLTFWIKVVRIEKNN